MIAVSAMMATIGARGRPLRPGRGQRRQQMRSAMPPEGSLSYMSRLKSCGARRDWPEVLVVLKELRQSEVFADTYHYTAAMTVGKRAGEWRAVLALLDELIATGAQPDLACFNAALAACVAAGRPAEARALLLERMPLCGLRPSASCYTAVGKAHAATGDWRGALEWFDEIGRQGLEPSFADYKVAIAAASVGSDLHRIVSLIEAVQELHPEGRGQQEWLWRLWSTAQHRLLCQELRHLLPPVDKEATAHLQRALSEAAHHGTMPSFADAGARSGYTLAHLAPRVAKLSDVLQLQEPSWLRPAATRAVRHAMSGGEALSIAGGPGFDMAALALLVSFERLGAADGTLEHAAGVTRATGGEASAGEAAAGDTVAGEAAAGALEAATGEALQIRVLDYEAGWAVQAGAMECALRRRFASTPLRLSCGLCDITLPLAHVSNAELRAALPRARLLVASYCVSENAISLRESGFVFFEDVVRAAAPGTLVLVLETTHRQFSGLVAAARRGAGANGLELACPSVASNSGFSLCFLKGGGATRGVATASGAVGAARLEGQAEEAALQALFERFDRDELVHAQKGYNRAGAP